MLLSDLKYEEYKLLNEDNSFWDRKMIAIIQQENISEGRLTRFSYGSNIVYSYNGELVIKLYPSYFKNEFERELEVLKNIENGIIFVEIPRLRSVGSYEGWDYLIMSELKGTLLIDLWDKLTIEEKKECSIDLGKVIREFHSIPSDNFKTIDVDWQSFIKTQYFTMIDNQKKSNLPQKFFETLEEYVDETYINYHPTPKLLTGEYTPFNLLFNKENHNWKLTGVIDFADCFLGDPEYDLLGPILFMFNGNKELTTSFLLSYGFREEELTDSFRKKLMTYTLLHRFSNIEYYISRNPDALKCNNFEELSRQLFKF
ncbi:aminoglycoside 3'-phosphotransferase/choline kinase family protein [Bacillus luteolus]|uniref:Aminoglycoside 3'-phosphotransferase/choline kinase family protein n=1 Tax=Litchfieldia luteola TaxID=682179 RepID=A0ABR9QD79_9BACI|nr:aminoglycoside 3'-phosphotransferase/choline kinase family protein [Cytobacillus luteolus]MBE4906457.1 aminoglycoside 3'-phosphotransferase/choline kinase family protein [Cytobacillus luteolus]MBP1941245.1 hygromycin-B 7''-O-kinase [Cytobacillus luteolus]